MASVDKRKERSCCKRNGMGCVKESTKDQNATSTSGGRGEGRLEATATKREKGGSREEEPHATALANEALNDPKVGNRRKKKSSSQTLKLEAKPVGKKESRVTTAYAKTQMNHALRGEDGALGRRDKKAKKDKGVDERKNRTSNLTKQRALRKRIMERDRENGHQSTTPCGCHVI